MRHPFYKQLDTMDCGPTCLRMIASHYGKDISLQKLRLYCDIQKQGVSMEGIVNAAERIGIEALPIKVTYREITERNLPTPCILHWNQNHFVVLYKLTRPKSEKAKFLIADPSQDRLINFTKDSFQRNWLGSGHEGLALLLSPAIEFDEEGADTEKPTKVTWQILQNHVWEHRKYFFQLFLGLLAASLLQLILPFLTQGIVDKGVNMHDISFVYIVLTAQLVLLVARFIIEFSRQSLLLYISTNVNLSLLRSFWEKLMHLPVSYFDSKQTGDIIQRLGDQRRIESFLTGNSITIAFSLLNLVIYSIVLLLYSGTVFLVFLIGSSIYLLWVSFFLRRRRKLNYERFAVAAGENNATMQMIHGMQEIKMYNAEKHFRWIWERLQLRIFKIGFRNLSLNQVQQAGALMINEGKNIMVTAIVATAVIKGDLTLGSMLAIQYILGALNSPVQQFTGFIQEFQDAKIALERLNEVHAEKEEPQPSLSGYAVPHTGISISNLSFSYTESGSDKVLRNINLEIPEGKVLAIVGMSGSGKTTLLRILQKFYDDKYRGEIKVGHDPENSGVELRAIVPADWRNIMGTVMQDGYIFSQTIAENIAVGQENPVMERLVYAARMANILSFIETLPLGFHTKIGMEGVGMSMGQRQRMLIARAVYKDPKILFFDEATNSLDANNEKVILENLDQFFAGRTVVVVAHRLSTVRNADKIVVLHQGEIVEAGTHDTLTHQRGRYYELVKNQLELGN
jgi:ATP-binding cassette subfamily B protein